MERTMSDTSSAPLLEISGARATIRLNRPKHLNRLQSEDLDDLVKLFDRIEADAAIRVLVLTGTGRAFSAGYDLNSVADRATSATERRIGVRSGGRPPGEHRRADDLPAQRRRLWRVDRSGAGLRFPYRRRYRRDVHAGGAAWPALLQERHRPLCVAARRQQRQNAVSHRAEDLGA